jgi:hypothetical protein
MPKLRFPAHALALVAIRSALAQPSPASRAIEPVTAPAPHRVVEMAYFHVPPQKVHLVADAQAHIRGAMQSYPGFLGNLSYQSVADSTVFLDYTLWTTYRQAEDAVSLAVADPEVAGVYFGLMDQVPFFGHAVALDDAPVCAIPTPAPGSVAMLRVVGLKPGEQAAFTGHSRAFHALLRGAGARYGETGQFVEYPEFYIDYVQFPSIDAARQALPVVRGHADLVTAYFRSANVTVLGGLFRPIGVVPPLAGCV